MADIRKQAGSGRLEKRCKEAPKDECPECTAISVIGPISGPDALVASEDIPEGFVVAPGGSARLAVADGTDRGNAIGIATASVLTGQIVPWAGAGTVSFSVSTWEAVTGSAGGLIPSAAYYLSQTTPGRLTSVMPTSGQIIKVGVAISATAFDVQVNGPLVQGPPGPGSAFTTWALKWSITQQPPGFGPSSLSDDAGGTGVVIGTTPFKFNRQYAFASPHKASSIAIRTQGLSQVGSGTIRVLRNGVVFASFPTPAPNNTSFFSLNQQFVAGDHIEVWLESLAILSITVVIEFQEPVPAVSGDPNTQAYFGPSGNLTDDVQATMALTEWELRSFPGGQRALRVGRTSRTVAIGNSVASGVESFAQGQSADASGQAAHAEGSFTRAQGNFSHAEGEGTTASGRNAHAEGRSVVASGDSSHAEGENTTASGRASHAEGVATTASAFPSHAEGVSTTASGERSHAEGSQSTASAFASHAEGRLTVASGDDAHAEGRETQASDTAAHAEGISTVASGVATHAEGSSTSASGRDAHAEGTLTAAIGDGSHAEGVHSQALRHGQHAHSSTFIESGGGADPDFPIGSLQTSQLVLFGRTPGLAANEDVELRFGRIEPPTEPGDPLILEDGKTYAFKITAACGGVQGLNQATRVLELSFNAKRGGGLSVIVGAQNTESYGDALANTWTLAASIGAAPDRVVLTFSTGVGAASVVNVSAKVEFTEVVFPNVIP